MPWAKIVKSKENIFWLLAFVVIFFLTRLPGLGTDAINPDGVNWHFRSQQFVVGLKTLDFARTYQHYHPGVTLMWLTGIPIELLKQLSGEQFYNHLNFLGFHYVAKFSVVCAQLVLSIVLIYFLAQILGFKKALLAVSFFSLEPFVLGNSRLYHMDVLLMLFMMLALVTAWLTWKTPKPLMAIITGVFVGLAFLTKSIGIILLPFVLLMYLYKFYVSKNPEYVKSALLVVLASVVTTFALFPALWVKPIYFLTEIFSEAERVGVRKGHGQILFGEYTRDGGVLFYPLVFVLKTSPVMLLGVLVALVAFLTAVVKKRVAPFRLKEVAFTNYLILFYLLYLVLMTVFSKKIDRYFLVVYPLLAIISIHGFEVLKRLLRPLRFKLLILATFVLFIGVALVAYYPYYFTYTNPLFGTAENANKLLAQKPFGIGIPALKDFILQRYGYYPALGFIDIKPMGTIYPNSKITDIREIKPVKEALVILGPNEGFEGKSVSLEQEYVKDSVLFINGLEYWRIYKRL